MLKITAYASAQPVATGRTGRPLKDGWGLPRQTIYLKQTKFGKFAGASYTEIANYQRDFFSMLNTLVNRYPDWARQHGWLPLPKIYNDPVSYSISDLHTDTEKHYTKHHDPALSMILRQQYLTEKLAKDLEDPTIVQEWGIDLKLKNPTEPVLAKFYDKGVLTTVAQNTTTINELFE